MRPSSILTVAAKFRAYLTKQAQQTDPPTNLTENNEQNQINYNQIAQEVNAVVEGFIARNPLKMATTQEPYIRQANEGQNGQVAVGFIVPKNEYQSYIRKMNNEIQKLQKKYPNVKLYAYYDTRDPRKAKL